MKCKKCGADNLENAKFCYICGEKIENKIPVQKVEASEEELLAKKANKKERSAKALNKALSIAAIVMFSILFLAVWGSVGRISYSSYSEIEYYYGYRSIRTGIYYFFYQGWVNFEHLLSTNKDRDFYCAMAFLVQFVSYVATITVVYIFGFKGMLKAIGNASRKENNNLDKYLLAVAIAYFANNIIQRNLLYAVIGWDKISYISNTYTGWNFILGGIVIWPVMIYWIVTKIITTYEKDNIGEFVGKFLRVAALIFILSIVNSLTNQVFNYNYSYRNAFEQFVEFFAVNKINSEYGPAMLVTVIIAFLTILTGISCFVLVIKSFTPQTRRYAPLICCIVFMVLILLTVATSNGVMQSINGNSNNYFYSSDYVPEELISCFTSSIILTGIMVANTVLTKKRAE